MTGPEHYAMAEECLNTASELDAADALSTRLFWLSAAQTHAMLALTAATVQPWGEVIR
jgi:hypothetical protein